MKHFSITEWTDFVRDVATEEQSAQMRNHLEEGCQACIETVQTWQSVTQYARQELSYEPPSSSLRIAESYFAQFKLALNQVKGMQIARLSFDSFERRLQAGVRGTESEARQLMYKCDDVFIDLRLEPKRPSNEVALVGQIVDSGKSTERGGGIPVTLLNGDVTVLQTSANQAGEFYFAFRPSQNLQLLFGLKETTVLLSLPNAEA